MPECSQARCMHAHLCPHFLDTSPLEDDNQQRPARPEQTEHRASCQRGRHQRRAGHCVSQVLHRMHRLAHPHLVGAHFRILERYDRSTGYAQHSIHTHSHVGTAHGTNWRQLAGGWAAWLDRSSCDRCSLCSLQQQHQLQFLWPDVAVFVAAHARFAWPVPVC